MRKYVFSNANSTFILKLNKALYGLKQASLVCTNNQLDKVLHKNGFKKSKID